MFDESNLSRKKLEELNQLYEALLFSTPDLVYVLDTDLSFIFANDALLDFMGYDKDELLGKRLQELSSDPETLVRYEKQFEKVIQTRNTVQGEALLRHHKRGKRFYHYIFMPILGSQGEVKAIGGATRDITERKQIEQALRKNEEKYRTLVTHFPNGAVGLYDHELRYTAIGGELVNKLGVAPEDRIGNKVSDIYPEDLVEEVEPYFKAALAGKTCSFEAELHNRHLFAYTLPIRDNAGEVYAGMLVVQDITERWKVKEELKEVNRTLEERVEQRTKSLLSYQAQLRSLASRLSRAEEHERHRLATELHDNLGQMLAVNKMKMESLPKDQMPDEAVSALEEIKEGMNDALVYTRHLMTDLKPPPVLDKEDVRQSIEWLAEKMDKHNLEVVVEDDGQPKRASEEIRTTLLQSVREVLFNIVKYAGVKETIIKMARQENRVRIIVEDEGQGFDPESKISSSVKEGRFGLFNIQERLDLLGGSMDIKSKPGEGTKVTLVAPLKSEVTPDPSAEGRLSTGDPTDGEAEQVIQEIKVMLVDDHQMIREGLKKIVNAEEDMKVVAEASDGREAVDSAYKTTPDIIVMDVDMPRMNGIDATREITSEMPETEVIALSFHNHQDVIESMRKAGASAFLSKEEAFETLCAIIRSEVDLKAE